MNRFKILSLSLCMSISLCNAQSFVKTGQKMPTNAPINTGGGGTNVQNAYVVNFTSNNMEIKFGGKGSYVYGDYTMTGKSIVENSNGGKDYDGGQVLKNMLADSNAKFLKENFTGFSRNSSEQSITLPKHVRSEDIVYVGLYWQGNLAKKGGNQSMADINNFIKGYQNVGVKIGNDSKIYNVDASYCGGLLSANGAERYVCGKGSSLTLACYNNTTKEWAEPDFVMGYNKDKVCDKAHGFKPVCKKMSGGTAVVDSTAPNFSATLMPKSDPGIRMWYGCGADITKYFKESAKDSNNFINQDARKFTVGNIVTSEGSDKDTINAYYNGSWKGANWKIGRFAGWSVIVVYSKDAQAQKELKEQLKKEGIQECTLDSDGNPTPANSNCIQNYIDSFYRPKSVTIYEGYKMLTGSTDTEDKSLKIKFDGFYTPKRGKIQAKLGFFGEGGEKSIDVGEHMMVSDGKVQKDTPLGDNCSNVKKWVDLNNGSTTNGSDVNVFDGSERILVPELGQTYKEENIVTGFKSYNMGLDLDEFNISDYLGYSQSSLCMNLNTTYSYKQVGNTVYNMADQSFIPMVAMSVDIYVPKLCYYDKIYNVGGWLQMFNKDGSRKKDVDVNKVEEVSGTVIAGEQLFYKTRFENRNTDDSDDANGLIVTIDFDNYNYYDTKKNSCTIDDNVEKIKNADFGDPNIVYVFLKNNTPGVWTDASFTSQISSSDSTLYNIYNDRQFQSVVEAPGGGQTLKFYIGRDTGKIGADGNIAGGEMKVGDRVYAEFNSTVGPDYKYHPLTYKVGYSINPAGSTEPVIFDGVPMDKCPDDRSSDNLSVTTLKGLKVVNQNYQANNDEQDERLYSQIAEQPFNVNLIFKPDFSHLLKGHCIKWNDDNTKCLEYDQEIKDAASGENPDFTLNEDGTLGKPVLKPFKLDGNLYLSVVRASDAMAMDSNTTGCTGIKNKDKIPFVVNGNRVMDNYKLDVRKDGLITNINSVEIEDAYQNITFMLSYVPKGMDLNSGATDDNSSLTQEQKDQIKQLEELFGIPMSPVDDSFHICDSDAFSVRPAYFIIDNTGNKIKKYAKTIHPDASGDITKAVKKFAKDAGYRIAGDYTENKDVAYNLFYAESAKNNGVPNYNPTIGGNISDRRFSVIDYGDKGAGVADKDKVVMQETFLQPFVSNQCIQVSRGALLVERDATEDKATFTDKKNEYVGMDEDGSITSITDKDAGKSTDQNNFRIWDIDGVSLWADFNTHDTKDNGDGTFTPKFNNQSDDNVKDYLDKQMRLKPSQKDRNSALLYTQVLREDHSRKLFNYYNVGDVRVNLKDNSWLGTDRLIDSKYNTAACILNSTSNTPDSKGMIGCDVGMKDDETLVLRYQPAKIEVAIKGVSNADHSNEFVNDAIRDVNYTYYNSPELENRFLNLSQDDMQMIGITNIGSNKAIVNDVSNLAKLEFGTKAFISNRIYPNVIATLFDGRVIAGRAGGIYYEVPRCGFAVDIDTNIAMQFDCNDPLYANDSRCARGLSTTSFAAFNYNPFANTSDFKNYTINVGQYNYLDDDSCSKPESSYDSRCFRYTPMSLVNGGDVAQDSSGKPLPLRFAINYYSDGSRQHNVINTPNTSATNGPVYSTKSSSYRLLSKGFVQGSGENVYGFFNFDRSQKIPNKPLIIIPSDFAFQGNANVGTSFKIPGFNKDGDLVNTNGGKLLQVSKAKDGDDSIENFSGAPALTDATIVDPIRQETQSFADYLTSIGEGNATNALQYMRDNNLYAYFVYGDVNYHGSSETVYGDMTGVDVPITARLYCGMNGIGCKQQPGYIGKTIFTDLSSSNSGWLNNIYAIYNADTIQQNFVDQYDSENTNITINRPMNSTANGELIRISSTQDGITAQVRVFTAPWFIYTPNESIMLKATPRMPGFALTGSSDGRYFYNYFNVAFRRVGNWGGEGHTKDGDVVGNFAGKDEKSNTNSNPRVNSRIDW